MGPFHAQCMQISDIVYVSSFSQITYVTAWVFEINSSLSNPRLKSTGILPARVQWCMPHAAIMRSSPPSKPYRRPWSWLGNYSQAVVLYHLHVSLNAASWLKQAAVKWEQRKVATVKYPIARTATRPGLIMTQLLMVLSIKKLWL